MQTIKRVILLYSNKTLHRLIIFSYHVAGAHYLHTKVYVFQSAAGNCQICYSNRIGVDMSHILLNFGTVLTFWYF